MKKMKLEVWVLTTAFFCGLASLEAEPIPESDKVSYKGKGAVTSSGKFTPKVAPSKVDGKAPSAEEAKANLQKALKLEPLGGEKFRIGEVVLDKKSRTVTIPVKVNMVEGVVEYALVTENGKAHEAIFTTAASPTHVHLACVLLGKSEVKGQDWPKDYTGITKDQAVKVEVTWPTNGPMKRYSLARFVVKKQNPGSAEQGAELATGDWLYSGSHFRTGVFVAESEGSIISIIGDGAALVNGLRKDHANDLMHTANKALLPPQGRTVKMVFTLPPVKAK